MSAGVVVNILGGGYERARTARPGGNLAVPAQTSPGLEDIAGTNIEIGVQARATPRIGVGVRASLPYERTARALSPLQPSTTDRQQRVEVPANFSVGVSYDLGRDRQVVLDIRSDPWSKAVFYNADADTVMTAPYAAFDATIIAAGFERSTVRDGFRGRDVRVSDRLGLFYRPTTFGDTKGKQVIRSGLAVGRGWQADKVTVDATFVYQQSNEFDRSTSAAYRSPFRERDFNFAIAIRYLLIP
jgi:hypothetical protein